MTGEFNRGPYGEILPPPLVAGASPEEAAEFLVQTASANDQPITTVPSRGKARDGHLNQALLFLHQQNLSLALSGDLSHDPDAAALRTAILRGEPLSLRPLGQEQLYFATFVPVLQMIGSDLWRIGKPNRGRHHIFQGSPGEAMMVAHRLYVSWAEEEQKAFKAWARRAITRLIPDYRRLIWLADLTGQTMTAELAPGFALQRLGKHISYRLITPKGWRIIETGRPERAVAIAQAVLEQQGLELPPDSPAEVLAALTALGQPLPQLDVNGWRVGRFKGQVIDEQRAVLSHGQRRYGLLLRRARASLVEPEREREIDRLALEPAWRIQAQMMVGLAWAGWKAGQA